MTHLINTKVLLSGAMILAAAAVIIGATFAFFSDTETSTGNTFVAGEIDLKIDNESFAIDHNIPDFNGTPSGNLVASTHTSWNLRDLTVEKFFDFVDLKPGDFGEDTISIHVGSNDAWLCAAAQITQDTDETCTEPESESTDPQCAVPTPIPGAGELDDEVNFAFWVDDGDNVFENQQGDEGASEEVFLEGPISGLGQQGQIALADFNDSILPDGGPIPGETTFFIGKAWCFGDMTDNNVPNDSNDNPVDRGETGFTCDGELVGNAAQTDKIVGDLEFFAIQSRNNDQFDCDEGYTPSWVTPTP